MMSEHQTGSTRRRILRRGTAIVIAAALSSGATVPQNCCRDSDVGGSATSGSSARITAWAINVTGPAIAPPGSMSIRQCTGWAHASAISGPDATWSDLFTFRVDPDGVVAALHYRDCGDLPIRQFVWIRRETGRSLAGAAMADLRSRLLVAPTLVLAPPTRSIVNLETWLAVEDPGVFQVTAQVTGLSSTVTARVRSTHFDTGDGQRVTCPGTGVIWQPADGDRPAPCGHTYRASDPNNQIRAQLEWEVHWRASDGSSGTLGAVTSAATIQGHPVTEVQTVGIDG